MALNPPESARHKEERPIKSAANATRRAVNDSFPQSVQLTTSERQKQSTPHLIDSFSRCNTQTQRRNVIVALYREASEMLTQFSNGNGSPFNRNDLQFKSGAQSEKKFKYQTSATSGDPAAGRRGRWLSRVGRWLDRSQADNRLPKRQAGGARPDPSGRIRQIKSRSSGSSPFSHGTVNGHANAHARLNTASN